MFGRVDRGEENEINIFLGRRIEKYKENKIYYVLLFLIN
jgi:hypothetical protein